MGGVPAAAQVAAEEAGSKEQAFENLNWIQSSPIWKSEDSRARRNR